MVYKELSGNGGNALVATSEASVMSVVGGVCLPLNVNRSRNPYNILF